MANETLFEDKLHNDNLTPATEEDPQVQELREQNMELQKEILSLKQRAIKVYEENHMLKADESVAHDLARLKADIALAEAFTKSGALPVKNPYEAYVIIKAGEEIGYKPQKALQALAIVKGRIMLHSQHLSGHFTGKGYSIDFSDESRDGVTVTMSKGDWVESYRVNRDDEILKRSTAMSFASKNKMRFHGIRQIVNFHLAHELGSVGVWDGDDMVSAERRQGSYLPEARVEDEEVQDIITKVNGISERRDLVDYWNILSGPQKKNKQIFESFKARKTYLINAENDNSK